MVERWSSAQVLALAPDAASASAARGLASPSSWTGTGVAAAPPAVWGLCAGSGSKPYQTVVDLTEPAYKCSCPSRKFPCKHALALLVLWSAGGVPEATAPSDFAEAWLTERSTRTAKKAASEQAPARSPAPDPRTAERRAERITAGAADLDIWLRDEIRTGIAGADRAGYGRTDQVAARLVDAQAPGLAGAVRRLAGVAASGEGWPGRLLESYAMLRLLLVAHQRLAELPEPLAATVRTRVGYPVRTDDVLATEPVRDRWDIVGLRDTADTRITTRRVHLRGSSTSRPAVVLSFAPAGQPLDASLVPGTSIDADLHFYPGALPLRAAVGARHTEPGPLTDARGLSITAARKGWAEALAADPWTTELPVVLADVTPVPSSEGTTAGWHVVDATGDTSLPLTDADALWILLAVSGGEPVELAADLTPRGLRATSVRTADGLVGL